MTPPLQVGYVVSNWQVKKRLTSSSGETLFVVACLGCGRSFNASEAQVSNLKPCGRCSPSTKDNDKPTRLYPRLGGGWRVMR